VYPSTREERVDDSSCSNTEAQKKKPRNEKKEARLRNLKKESPALSRKTEAVTKDNEKYPAIVETLPELICRFLPDGTLTFVNQTLARWIGKRPDDVIHRNFFDYLSARQRARVRKKLATLSPENPVVKIEEKVLNPNREMSWMRWIDTAICGKDGRVVEIQGVGRDVTEMRRMEQSLEKSEQRFQHLLETMSEGFTQVDKTLVLIYVNPRLCDMLGYEREELLGRSVLTLLDKENEKILLRQFGERKKGKSGSYQISWKQKSGGDIQVLLSAVPEFDDKGVFKGSHAVITDITALKKAQQALKDRETTLKRKEAELTEANIALKTMLKVRDESTWELKEEIVSGVKQTIMPYLRKLEKGLAEKERGYLRKIESNLDNLISPLAMNSASKFGQLTPTELEVAALVRDGNSSEEIATLLDISRKTVEFHRQNIRKKLGVKSNLRAHLITRYFPSNFYSK
jgi:PAS domain S-box-containing protein